MLPNFTRNVHSLILRSLFSWKMYLKHKKFVYSFVLFLLLWYLLIIINLFFMLLINVSAYYTDFLIFKTVLMPLCDTPHSQ